MTDSGRRVKFRCVVAVGDRNGFVGYAEGRDDQVGSAIQKAIGIAKLNMIQVPRGSGSWEDRSDRPHSLTRKTTGKAGSVEVEVIPAPKGSDWPPATPSVTSSNWPASRTPGPRATATLERRSTSRKRRTTRSRTPPSRDSRDSEAAGRS